MTLLNSIPAGEPLSRRPHDCLQRVLLATDGCEAAETAVRLVSLLHFPTSVTVEVLTVTQPLLFTSPEWFRIAQEEWACGIVRGAVSHLQKAGLHVTWTVRCGEPAREILHEAQECKADLIVLGLHGLSGLEGFLLGSVARNVAEHSDVPVLIARGLRVGTEKILLAVDGSDHSLQAAELLATLPLPPNASITVVHVVRRYDPFPGIAPTDPGEFRREVHREQERRQHEGARLLEPVLAELRQHGRSVRPLVVEGDPATEIARIAREMEVDLIVSGARGVSGWQRLLVGSVASRLLHTADRPLLLVR